MNWIAAVPGRVSGILPQRSPRALGMQYVFGLEFVELKDAAHGFHGNAIFSRWPILWAEVLRLPEQYNWYYDRQKRIGRAAMRFLQSWMCRGRRSARYPSIWKTGRAARDACSR